MYYFMKLALYIAVLSCREEKKKIEATYVTSDY